MLPIQRCARYSFPLPHAGEKSVRDKRKKAKILNKSIFTCVPEMSHLVNLLKIANGFCWLYLVPAAGRLPVFWCLCKAVLCPAGGPVTSSSCHKCLMKNQKTQRPLGSTWYIKAMAVGCCHVFFLKKWWEAHRLCWWQNFMYTKTRFKRCPGLNFILQE